MTALITQLKISLTDSEQDYRRNWKEYAERKTSDKTQPKGRCLRRPTNRSKYCNTALQSIIL